MKICSNRFAVQWHFIVVVWSLSQISSYSQVVSSHSDTSDRGSSAGRPEISEVIDATTDYLVPANTKGNPGFTYAISSAKSNGSPATGDSSCQGTLISAINTICVVATAAHCLYPQMVKAGLQSLRGNFCGTANGEPAKSGEVAIETADFGKVKAQAIVHPLAKPDGSDVHDVGILKFSCPEGAKNVPVVKVASSPMQPDEDIWYGKVKGAKGLWTGRAAKNKVTFKFKSANGETRTQTYDNTLYEDKRQSDNTRHVVVQNSDHSAQTGDSGGPALAERDGEKVLIGILSGTPGVSSAAIYQTNSSMDFIKCFAEKKGEASGAVAKNGSKKEEKRSADIKTEPTPEGLQAAQQSPSPREVASQSAPKALNESSKSQASTQSAGSAAPQNPGGQHCEGGVCQVGPKQAGLGATGTDFFGSPSNPSQQGVQGQPVEQGTPEFQQPIAQQPSVKPSQGFKEVQATDEASFKQALRQARQDGVKHVIVTYGNYDQCLACRNLRDELQQQFGNDGDVRVIKMPEEFRPDAKGFIPQSRILTPKPNGMWEQSPTRVGSTGTAANYKAEVDRLRQTQPTQQEPQLSQGPAEQTGASQPQPQQTIAQAPETGAATPRFEDIKPEFEADGYKFAKESDGTLVRIGSDGQKKIPRLQQLPSGKSDLVYDAHPNSPVPFVRASNKEREKLRDYYLGIKKGDATAWDKMPASSKALIDGYLNNWDELANKYHWEALKAKESKPAEEPKVVQTKPVDKKTPTPKTTETTQPMTINNPDNEFTLGVKTALESPKQFKTVLEDAISRNGQGELLEAIRQERTLTENLSPERQEALRKMEEEVELDGRRRALYQELGAQSPNFRQLSNPPKQALPSTEKP